MELTQVKKYLTNYTVGWCLMLALTLPVFGCLNKERIIVHYKFKGTEISRCDKNKKSYFFYGNCNSEAKIIEGASVMLDWQFDDFLQAALIFHEGGTVEIMKNGVGEFSLIKEGGRIFFKEYESPEHNRITQKYLPPNRFHNFCRLSDNLAFEAKTNKKFGSDVVAEYLSEAKILK